ncbi:MAG: hypothetical protein V4556_11075 [Bacteroidota bacterium]
MKKNLTILFAFTLLCAFTFAQGNSGGKGKGKGKSHTVKVKKNKTTAAPKHDNTIWNGTENAGTNGSKVSKNQPRKVTDNFNADYPNARNVVWTKYRGDWTATFSNGLFGRHTAVYHANGQRKDTRIVTPWNKVPVGVSETTKKRFPLFKHRDIVKVETANGPVYYRVPYEENKYIFLDNDGNEVTYDY